MGEKRNLWILGVDCTSDPYSGAIRLPHGKNTDMYSGLILLGSLGIEKYLKNLVKFYTYFQFT